MLKEIKGNIKAVIQQKSSFTNEIGESESRWHGFAEPYGFLSMQSADSKYNNFNAKIEESTHVFLTEYDESIYALRYKDLRLICKGVFYDVLFVDNPDERDEQLEIYLRYVGGQ